jgi:hypothetical protein
MSVKSALARPYASVVARQIRKWSAESERTQEFIFRQIIHKAKDTVFGKEHDFAGIATYDDFKNQVPINDYEGIRNYIERIKAGEENILWKGKPVYFAKTSGTTSGTKYIPITEDSISNHINSARNALLMYINETGNNNFVNGKMIFLSGSPVLENVNGILTGRLSGIVNHHVPKYLRKNQLPSYETNCIEDWEKKVDEIVSETHNQNMTLISGIPPWVTMYFEKLLKYSNKKTIKKLFPNFSLFVHGGVNFEPYKNKLHSLIGEEIDSIETYPASEGFIAFQDSRNEEGLLLNVDSGIFFEFIPTEEIHSENRSRLRLTEIELNKNYAIVLSSNAGLWSYLIGDTIKFVNKNPHRIVVTGRISHFISAFGEHVIAEEVESAFQNAVKKIPAEIIEFTVAPQVQPREGKPYHEWLIEFATQPADLETFRFALNKELENKNSYYKDLIAGNILQPLHITQLPRDAFRNYMKSLGKLGGQNKVPRLSNDRKIADALSFYL